MERIRTQLCRGMLGLDFLFSSIFTHSKFLSYIAEIFMTDLALFEQLIIKVNSVQNRNVEFELV